MIEPRSNRQLRADDTHARLFSAASELFAIRGFHDTTVEAIARRAGVAKGTFFLHFATKDAVITELIRVQLRAVERARAAAHESGKGALAALRASMITLGAQAGLSRELSRAVLTATLDNADVSGDANALFEQLFAGLASDARRAIRDGELDKKGDGELLALKLMTSYLGATFRFASARGSAPLAQLLHPLIEANIAGFRTQEDVHVSPRTTHAARRRPTRRRP